MRDGSTRKGGSRISSLGPTRYDPGGDSGSFSYRKTGKIYTTQPYWLISYLFFL